MKKNRKKMVVPIIVSVIVICYCIAYVIFFFTSNSSFMIKAIGAVVMFAVMGVMLFVLAERIKEIRSGEEDDISKY